MNQTTVWAVTEILAQRFTASVPEPSQRAVTLLLGHSLLPLALRCPRPTFTASRSLRNCVGSLLVAHLSHQTPTLEAGAVSQCPAQGWSKAVVLNAGAVPTLQRWRLCRGCGAGWGVLLTRVSSSIERPCPGQHCRFQQPGSPPRPLGVLSKSCTSDINGRQLWQRNY